MRWRVYTVGESLEVTRGLGVTKLGFIRLNRMKSGITKGSYKEQKEAAVLSLSVRKWGGVSEWRKKGFLRSNQRTWQCRGTSGEQ